MKNSEKIKIGCLINTSYAGSTITALLMGSHPQIATVGENLNPRIFRRKQDSYPCSCGEILERCDFWNEVADEIRTTGPEFKLADLNFGHKYQTRWRKRILGSYRPNIFLRLFSRAIALGLPGNLKRVNDINDLNVRFVRAVLNTTGAKMYFHGGKSLMGHQYLMRVPEFELKFVRIVRDVRAIAASFKQKDRSINEAVEIWRKYQTAANTFVATLPPETVIQLSYEELMSQPDTSCKKIYEFLGVDSVSPPGTLKPSEQHITGNKLRLLPELTIRPVDSWRDVLTDADLRLFDTRAMRLNRSFGYE